MSDKPVELRIEKVPTGDWGRGYLREPSVGEVIEWLSHQLAYEVTDHDPRRDVGDPGPGWRLHKFWEKIESPVLDGPGSPELSS